MEVDWNSRSGRAALALLDADESVTTASPAKDGEAVVVRRGGSEATLPVETVEAYIAHRLASQAAREMRAAWEYVNG